MSAPAPTYSDAAVHAGLDALGAVAGWLSVHDGDPGATGAAEVPGTARSPVIWEPAAGREKVGTAADVAMPAGSVLAHLGLWTAPSGGDFLTGTDPIEPPVSFAGAWTAYTPRYTLSDSP